MISQFMPDPDNDKNEVESQGPDPYALAQIGNDDAADLMMQDQEEVDPEKDAFISQRYDFNTFT